MLVDPPPEKDKEIEGEESEEENEKLEHFPFSRKLVRNLWKCKMCIKPLSNKGSVSTKKKAREVTNLLRAMEKEIEEEETEAVEGQSVSE